ncbi:MAG: hypothetical protein GF311_20195 [Candidatus Lokiarchaeota archaeon]|nr:hypothetical protein [Candidatus Lokiarchaeota archaeon]
MKIKRESSVGAHLKQKEKKGFKKSVSYKLKKLLIFCFHKTPVFRGHSKESEKSE